MSESTSGPDLFNRLADEFAERYRRGERPPLGDYADRYPGLAEQIRELFPALIAIEQAGSEAGQATGPTATRPDGAGPIPERLGDYRILREIARGGMGIVYEAVQESLGRHVALKVLPQYRMHDPNQLERFEREARAAAMLHHTNIVPVFGVGEHNGVHHYAMQYIQGQTLDAVLREVKRLRGPRAAEVPPRSVPGDAHGLAASVAMEMVSGWFASRAGAAADTEPVTASHSPGSRAHRAAPPDRERPGPSPSTSTILGRSGASYYRSVARIGIQAAEAIAYAHHHKVLHRDIKPSNLLLDLQGTVWVTDFGLAKAEGTDALTQAGDIVGTLRYMAPERFQGLADPRSDVYALGLTLYEMLALEPAFAAGDRARLIDKILHHEPSRPRQIDPRIPSDLETIALKAIAKDPSDRYGTASELAEDLTRYLADRPILARRASALEQARRWCRRNPVVASSIAIVAGALVAVAGLALLYARQQRHFALAQGKANTEITRLNSDLGKERDRLTTSLAASNRLLAIRDFDRGQAAFEKDQIGPGLLWMIESWRSAIAAGDPVWQHAARANLAAWQPHHARLKAVLSHERPVEAAAFSPDGKTVLTAGDDRIARCWDAASGRPIGHTLRHDGVITSVAFSPDGKTILTGSIDRTARLWDAASGRPVGSPLVHGDEVRAVAFSPDGRTFLTGSNDKTARLWDSATRAPIGRPLAHQAMIRAVAFSPDGKAFLTSSNDGEARLWNRTTGQPIGKPLSHSGSVEAVSFSADGRMVLIGTGVGDQAARLWDVATGQPIGSPLRGHRGKVRAVACSPDGRTFLTGSDDKTARLWDAATLQPIGPLVVHQGPVVAGAFSPDGRTFLTVSSDNTVRLWDADPGQPFGLIRDREDSGPSVAFSPDGRSIFSGNWRGVVKRWDAATSRILGPTVSHQGPVPAVAVSPDGTRLLTASEDKTARLWDTATGKLIGSPLQHKGHVSVVAFRPDGRTIMTGGEDRTVRLWDSTTGTPLGPPLPQAGSVDAGAFSPDGKSFVTGYDSGSAQVWDLATRTPRGRPFPHPGCISCAAFSPDGKALLTGCEDGAARIWDLETRTLRIAPLLHQAWIWAVAFSPDGKIVLTGSRDKTARRWDAATGMPLGPSILHPSQVWSVAFSPDGKSFLTGASDDGARLFRNVPELPDDPERIATWVEVLTGLTLDASTGTIRVLDDAAWRGRRAELERLGGPPETGDGPRLDPILFGLDPLARGRALMQRQRWDEAEAAFDEVVRARPYNASSWIGRGEFHIARGHAERAAADVAGAIQAQPENLQLRYFQVVLLLNQADRPGLRRACSDLLARYAATTNPQTANTVAWSCSLAPDVVADRETPVRLAEAALAAFPTARQPIVMNTLGAALYRAGRFEESIRWLEEGIRKRGGQGLPQDWAFLALAHEQLGHGAAARSWLDRFRTYTSTGRSEAFWDELEIRLLRNEAEALVLYDPVFPTDPFARFERPGSASRRPAVKRIRSLGYLSAPGRD